MQKEPRIIVLATANAHKVEEISRQLSPKGYIVKSAKEYLGYDFDVEETGTTFIENSMLKAKALHSECKNNVIVIADDSGLIVDAMPNELGLYTARYKKELPIEERFKLVNENVKKAGIDTARFVCCISAIFENGDTAIIEKNVFGTIVEPKGTNGFAFDPIFLNPVLGITNAEMTAEQKEATSHRGLAIKELLKLF